MPELSAAQGAEKPPRSSLQTRVVTALSLAPILLAAIIWLPHWGLWLLAAMFAAAAMFEWTQFAQISKPSIRWCCAGLMAAAAAPFGFFLGTPAAVSLSLLGVVAWLAASAWLAHSQWGTQYHTLKLIFGALLVLIGASAIGLLMTSDGSGLRQQGRFWFLLLLLVIWAADIGAYFTGKAIGRRKLAPLVSPNKTWEGVFGGLILVTLVVVSVGSLWFNLTGHELLWLVGLGWITAISSIIGDLFVSMHKRHADLKDAGRLFPGHGGVLDRFDSLLAAAPIFLLGKLLLGL